MDYSRAQRRTNRAKSGKTEQGRNHRFFFFAGAGMNHQSGRLVYYNYVLVIINNRKVKVSGNEFVRNFFAAKGYVNNFAAFKSIAGLGLTAV